VGIRGEKSDNRFKEFCHKGEQRNWEKVWVLRGRVGPGEMFVVLCFKDG
jgi:hypothetical protein